MTKPMPGLGKGIDGLIPEDVITEAIKVDEPVEGQVLMLGVDKLQPSDAQPRQSMNEENLSELANSIKEHGVLQPLIAVKRSENLYDIIAGERRWRASQKAGLTEVPVIVRSFDEQTQLETALIENLQREDLTALELAVGFERLVDQHNVDVKDIAKRLGKGESTIRNIIRLLNLPATAKKALQEGKINEGHARAVLSLDKHEKQQQQLLDYILDKQWSVHQAEQYAKAVKDGAKDAKQALTRVAVESESTMALSRSLGTKVYVRNLAKGGRLIIEFGNDKQLETIIDSLSK